MNCVYVLERLYRRTTVRVRRVEVANAVPPKTLRIRWVVRDVPQRIIVRWIGRHALLELDDIGGILDILSEMRIVDKLEDG